VKRRKQISSGVMLGDERERTADDVSKGTRRCQNRKVHSLPRSVWQSPISWPSGIRYEGSVTVHQALMRNVRTCRRDAKGESQVGGPHEAGVPKRGTGTEQPVVVMTARESESERRGCVIQHLDAVNREAFGTPTNGLRPTRELLASMASRSPSLMRSSPRISTSSGTAWHRAATSLRRYVGSRSPKAMAERDRWVFQR
jgi:hypothetical protein